MLISYSNFFNPKENVKLEKGITVMRQGNIVQVFNGSVIDPKGKKVFWEKKLTHTKTPLILQWFLSLQCSNLQIHSYSLVFNMLC